MALQEVFEDGVSSTAPAESWITQLLVTPTYVVTLTKTGRCMVYDKGQGLGSMPCMKWDHDLYQQQPLTQQAQQRQEFLH